ncbi:MAG: hypothetical protein HDR05_12585 [Lachnospiraceae bacterium]|nr:hypothetical protein [Lachnospiraceae bacterium]
MILRSDFSKKYQSTIKVYLETYPYKIKDLDFSIILDSGYEYSRFWIDSIKWIPRNDNDHVLRYFADGGKIWITDICGNEHELIKDMLVVGIGNVLKKHENSMVDYKQEIISACIDENICDEIIQLTLYGEIKFK